MQKVIIIAFLASCAFAMPWKNKAERCPKGGESQGICGTIAGLTCDAYPDTECLFIDPNISDDDGKCCPKRPTGRNCDDIGCIAVFCDGQFTPPGKCCPICPGPKNA